MANRGERVGGSDQVLPSQSGIVDAAEELIDVVDEWGYESFPASDPPQAWCFEWSRPSP